MTPPDISPASKASAAGARLGAGLTEGAVVGYQAILRKQCGREVSLPEAWSGAVELLSLVEMLLEPAKAPALGSSCQQRFAPPRS